MGSEQNCIDHALRGKALRVLTDESAITKLSDGERVLVALILDRSDLLPRDYTMLDAYNRLGPELTEAALRVQRAGLHCEETAHG
ncbi:MAG TPA: hypothetical protein VK580_10765 [Steroidobacteraceae bacterium]|nr:hypothetical protein [Steroidobacteraceae bacterium]